MLDTSNESVVDGPIEEEQADFESLVCRVHFVELFVRDCGAVEMSR